MGKIVVVGSSNTDNVVDSKKIPSPGETVLGGDFNMISGGKGANQAVAASRAGSDVTFICKVGNDYFGKRAIEEYKKVRKLSSYKEGWENWDKYIYIQEAFYPYDFINPKALFIC